MTYTDLLPREVETAEFLIVLKPAIRAESWTLVSSTTYYTSFDYGIVIDVTQDGVTLTEGSSPSVSPSEWYYDIDNEILYVNVSSGDANNKFLAVTYEIYSATTSLHWYRIPTDSSTRLVFFDATTARPPSFKALLSDSLLGFLPTQSSQLVLNNAEHTFEKYIYDSSFFNKQIDVYHWLSDLSISNIKKVISGKMGDVKQSGSTVTIQIKDRVDLFKEEWRNPGKSFYNTTDFPDVDPLEIGNPITYVYGMAEGVVATNIDYEEDSPTTSDNRKWAVRDEGTKLNTASATVPAAPASTNTRTYMGTDGTDGFNIGDFVKIDKATDEYREITNIDRTSDYIEHAALVSGAAASGDTVSRATISAVYIEQGGSTYEAMFDRDYTEANESGVLSIVFNSSVESNLGISTFSGAERVYCRVYGKQNDVTIGGGAFGSDSTIYGNLTDPIVILYDILKGQLGIPEADINTASFQTIQSSKGSIECGFAVPYAETQSFPEYKEVINDLLTTALIRLYLDFDSKWKLGDIAVLGTADKSIDDDEILLNTFEYDFRYGDVLSDVIVSYRYNQALDKYQRSTRHSDTADYLHGISKQKTFKTYLLESTDAATQAKRLGYIFGDRSGKITLETKNRFFDSEINDIIQVEREKLAGYEFIEGTERTRKAVALEIEKALRKVTLVLDDQNGIEQNSSDF